MSEFAPKSTDAAAPTAPTKRRWTFRKLIQFRLRTLLGVTAVFGALLAWHLRQARLQREAITAIRDFGGWVYYDYHYSVGKITDPTTFDANAQPAYPDWLIDQFGIDFFHSVVTVNLVYNDDVPGKRQDNSNISDEVLVRLADLPNTRLLLLKEGQATDEGMEYVGQLTDLEGLYMWDATFLTDAGVAQLARCRNLEVLHISNSQITDASMPIFARMAPMRYLSLQFNHFSDRGIEMIQGLRNLESLWVCTPIKSPSEITDASFKVFDQFSALTELGIQNTNISPEAVSTFKQRHPNCGVVHRFPNNP